MKAQKRLNVILIVLIVLLISLVSFVGIFYKDKNQMVNKLPNYSLGTDLTGYRKVALEVSKDTEAKTTTENVTTEDNTTDNTTDNSVSTDKLENNKAVEYKKSANIIKARLKSLEIDNYTVSCDENTGKIEITLPENDQTDTILADITQKGLFTITDSETEETLITNSDVSKVKVGTTDYTTYKSVYMSINFNINGTKKFKNITANYQNMTVDSQTIANSTTLNENTINATEAAGEANTNNTENVATNETTTTTNKDRTVIIKIDDTTMLTTDFSQVIDNGVLSLTVGSSADNSEIKDKLYGGKNIAAIIENEAMPLQYEVKENNYVASTVDNDTIKTIIYIEIALALLIALFMIIKFRSKGIITVILSIGFIAILLLVLRYANVTLSIEGILAILIAYTINCIFEYMLCNSLKEKSLSKKEKEKRIKNVVKKYTLILIPELIIAIICCLTNWNSILSLGMVMFWGIVISWIYNVVLSKFVL